MKNIILIGMPGCGKSTIGVLLAKTLGTFFIDTDLIIQVRQKNTLQRIIDTEGIENFLRYEEEALLTVDGSDSVVATGGSAVFSEKAMKHLKSSGICVMLDVPLFELEKRLRNVKTRGIACKKGETVADIMKTREPFYSRWADIRIDCHGLFAEEIVEKVAEAVKNRL